MTPAQIQQKLNELRAKKKQMDADLSSMAASVDDALKPIRNNRSKLKQYWGEWQKYNSGLMREKLVGKKKGEKRVRVIARLIFGKDAAEAYADAWEAAPKAVENIDKIIGDLLGANDRLQKAKAAVLSVQIPSSVSSPSQLNGIKTALDSAKTSSNQAVDSARSILVSLPSRRNKIKPLISAALRLAKAILEKLNKREERLENRKLVIGKKKRLEWIDDGQKAIKPYYQMAQKLVKETDEFVDSAPAREQSIKSRQVTINNQFLSIQSGLSITAGGSSNRPEQGSGDAILHVLAIGAVAAGIYAFDHFERRA
jgi:chromosome segregation ATPase